MATKKITLNELRSLVKQIIKEEATLNELSPELLQRAAGKAAEQGRTLTANKFSAAASSQIYKAQQVDREAKLEPMKPFKGKELNIYYDIKTDRGIMQGVGINHKISDISVDTEGVMQVRLYTDNKNVPNDKAFFFIPELDHYRLSAVGFRGDSFLIRGLDQIGAQLLWKLAKAFKPDTQVGTNTLVDGVATPIAGKAFQPTQM
jgi:hypothetical protein